MGNNEIILDLDGTLSNESIGDVIDNNNLGPEEYDRMIPHILKFTPKRGVTLLKEAGINPIIITGRQEGLREATEAWLKKYDILYKKLVMVPNGYYGGVFDWNKYVEYKIKAHKKFNVEFSIDDHESLVTILREYGVPAFHVRDNFAKAFVNAWLETHTI